MGLRESKKNVPLESYIRVFVFTICHLLETTLIVTVYYISLYINQKTTTQLHIIFPFILQNAREDFFLLKNRKKKHTQKGTKKGIKKDYIAHFCSRIASGIAVPGTQMATFF